MELYDMMTNISGKSNETELINSILCVKQKLIGLTKERMCKVYNGYLSDELLRRHIPSRIVNTLDFGLDYEHVFVLVAINQMNDYYLADLTFSQFNLYSERFGKLLVDGYQKIDDKDLNNYLNLVTKEQIAEKVSLDNIFFNQNQLKR